MSNISSTDMIKLILSTRDISRWFLNLFLMVDSVENSVATMIIVIIITQTLVNKLFYILTKLKNILGP